MELIDIPQPLTVCVLLWRTRARGGGVNVNNTRVLNMMTRSNQSVVSTCQQLFYNLLLSSTRETPKLLVGLSVPLSPSLILQSNERSNFLTPKALSAPPASASQLIRSSPSVPPSLSHSEPRRPPCVRHAFVARGVASSTRSFESLTTKTIPQTNRVCPQL